MKDLGRCGPTPYRRVLELVLTPGMWAVVGYRYRRWVYRTRLPWPLRPLRWVLNAVAVVVKLWVEVASNVELSSSAAIGPGLYVPHTGYVVVGSGAVLGSNCTLTQGVTIGHGGGGGRVAGGSPVLGDRVYVGPGAAVIGPVRVGDDALVGVGAVVTRSVPPRGVVAGNPARLLSTRGSFDLIDYPGMEGDPARRDSLGQAAADAGVGHGVPVRGGTAD